MKRKGGYEWYVGMGERNVLRISSIKEKNFFGADKCRFYDAFVEERISSSLLDRKQWFWFGALREK